MKVFIMAGGRPSTISKDRTGIPKPMVEIGGKPMLWHIMKHFSEYGYNDFVILGGYRQDIIKEYFKDYYIYASDITVDLATNEITIHRKVTEDWKVTIVDTGIDSSTGKRLMRAKEYVDDTFIVTYGDCISDVDVNELVTTHFNGGKLGTLAMAHPSGRNKLIPVSSDGRVRFNVSESSIDENAWTNANCAVLEPETLDGYINLAELEQGLFMNLSKEDELAVYKHEGFWLPIETMRDLEQVEWLWNKGSAPWIKEGYRG